MLLTLAEGEADTRWFPSIGRHADPDVVTAALVTRLPDAAGVLRDRLVEVAASIDLRTASSRRCVGTIAIALLTTQGNQAKSEAASRLAELVQGTNYQVKGQLRDAIAVADDAGHLSDRSTKRFEATGLIAKKRRKFLGITLP